MTDANVLDRKALACARRHMTSVAWPTVILGLGVTAAYLATVGAVLAGVLSLWFAVPLVATLTYASYTVAHDAVHGSISGNHRSLRWLNRALGYMMAWLLMIPLTAHRYEHMDHHRHTNDPEKDPDYPVAGMRNSVVGAAKAAVQIVFAKAQPQPVIAVVRQAHIALQLGARQAAR